MTLKVQEEADGGGAMGDETADVWAALLGRVLWAVFGAGLGEQFCAIL